MTHHQPADFDDFLWSLFPTGANAPEDFRSNPADEIPDEVQEMLEQIHEDTEVPLEWLERTAGLVVNGLAGLKCLWYLHGVEGTVSSGEPVIPRWVSKVTNLAVRATYADNDERRRELQWVKVTDIDWKKANFVLSKEYMDDKVQTQTLKLGKWLEKFITSENIPANGVEAIRMRYELKNRAKSDQIGWRISAHPYDVLTMSYKRPWSSCMKPGSDYEWQYGLLTDMAAGSAVMFFYAPGSDIPMGRLSLRPAVSDSDGPMIASGRTINGSGPQRLPAAQIEHMLKEAGMPHVIVRDADLCDLGSEGRALSRLIYSDVASEGCHQKETEYDGAYMALARVFDREDLAPVFDEIKDLRVIADEWFDDVSCDLDELHQADPDDLDVDATAIILADNLGLDDLSAADLLEFAEDNNLSRNEAVTEWLVREYDQSIGDLYESGWEDTISELEWALQNKIDGFLYDKLRTAPALLLAYREGAMSEETKEYLAHYSRVKMQHTWQDTYSHWKGSPPTEEIQNYLRLGESNWRSPAILPSSQDPRQVEMESFRTPLFAENIVAIWMDEDAIFHMEEEFDTGSFEDDLEAFASDADVWVLLPAGEFTWEGLAENVENR